jgi:hypothetical protein
MLIAGSKAVAALPVADPLWRNVDQRLAGCEGWPVRRQRPDTIGQDADEDVFGWEGAASVVSQPLQVLCDDAHALGRLQRFQGLRYPAILLFFYSSCPPGLSRETMRVREAKAVALQTLL